MSVISLQGRPPAPAAESWADRLSSALDGMAPALLVLDADLTVWLANAQASALLGAPLREGEALAGWLQRAEDDGLLGPEGARGVLGRLQAWLDDGAAEPLRVALADGRTLGFAARPTPGPGGAPGWVLTADDVTGWLRGEDAARAAARQDGLTGLPNRLLFHERLSEWTERAARTGEPLAVMVLDLDRFKIVNDTLGHGVGDLLLKAVSGRLKGIVRGADFVARLGGDEFAVLQTSGLQPRSAGALARRLVEAVARPFMLDGHMVDVGASVGVAVGPADGREPDLLLRNADLALYRAKGEGRGAFRFFETAMDDRMQARRTLEADLRRAVALGQFEVHYQPQARLDTNRVVGFEALLRWRSPERGLLGPSEFIALAEEVGLIVPIGEWVLATACDAAAGWPADIGLSVNISPLQFRHPRLVAGITSALGASGLDPQRLELEITEGVLLAEGEAALHTLRRIRDLGVRLSMDDFGTGYSSLAYLQRFPFDRIKIDQSFIRTMMGDKDCAAIVRAVAGLGASLGMRITAEGVETLEQVARIRADGCTDVQGYLISRPVPADAVAGLLRAAPAAWAGRS